MDRREAVQHITLLLGGTILGAEVFLSGCKTNGNNGTFSQKNIDLLNEIGDTILPPTKTPVHSSEHLISELMVEVKI